MKLTSVLIFFFIWSGSPVSNFDLQALFGDKQMFSINRNACIVPAPSANKVAIVTSKECSFFELSEDGEHWEGPFSVEHGYNMQVGDEWPPFWLHEKSGKEVLVLDQRKEVGVCLEKGRIVSGSFHMRDKRDVCEPETGRLCRPLTSFREKDKAQIMKLLSLKKKTIGDIHPEQKKDAEKKYKEIDPENIYALYDLSPKNTSILCRFKSDGPLVSLDLSSGDRITFPIKGRPRVLDSDMYGSYSPDGEWVLMQYSYGPDDHYSGGYLQLFDKYGHFVCEVAQFYDDVPAPVGQHFWLHNNWIVYFDGHDLIFQKFLHKQ
ncbi:MAG TPA: hypothetical protein PLI09_19005 [Candidatus Hydrogenedentes bacterium]|nr:hypothetical protein [Candidatus Hydrogenedentota bacterium]